MERMAERFERKIKAIKKRCKQLRSGKIRIGKTKCPICGHYILPRRKR